MIRLDRSRVPVPEDFDSEPMRIERAGLSEFYGLPRSQRPQRKYKVSASLWRDTEPALFQLSSNKCAYCETPLADRGVRTIDSFRPTADAMSLDGVTSSEHYWWLTYEWTNLVPACRDCNRLKGRRFPVEGKRAPIGTIGDPLQGEQPLLLNPFEDQPDEHLIFSDDAVVAGKTDRGRVSIEVFGLNRTTLVKRRLDALRLLRTQLQSLVSQPGFKDQLRALVADDQSFAAPRRQFLNSWLRGLHSGLGQSAMADATAITAEHGERPAPSHAEQKRHFAKYRADQARQEAYSIDREESKADYYIRTRLIERIEIENFKPIGEIQLGFTTETSELLDTATDTDIQNAASHQTPWLMLLGENGSGKSSVIQAVALCLLGDRWRKRIKLDAREFVRHGARTGKVRVFLTGSPEPIQMTFSRRSAAFTSKPSEPKVLLLGYGSTRLLPRAGVAVEGRYDFAQTDNLFNPFVALGDANKWLLNLPAEAFDKVATSLKSLLRLADTDSLVRVGRPKKRVEADLMGTRITLDELSDGYQSVLALTCDIMRVLMHRWSTLDNAEGIVLLDEIGAHLHPTWRMRIVQSMREVFPRVQFLASTHDPLCLRGLDRGEVAVMRRDSKNRVTATTEGLPSVRGLRADQLLTSEYFGLSSTIDPDLEKLFTEYYRLLADPSPTSEEQARIAALRTDLDAYRVLGSNRRERLMLEVIDKFLAEEPDIPDEALRAQLTESTKKRVREIWDGATPAQAQLMSES